MNKKILSLVLACMMALVACCAMAETLTVSAWDPNFNIPALEAAAADYKVEHPDFELVINTVSGSSDVELAMMTAGSSGDYSTLSDIVLFQDHFIQR